MLPGLLVWSVVGVLLNLAPVGTIALAMAAAYGCYYGAIQSLALPGLPPPGRRWQIPGAWVNGFSVKRRLVVWGTLLGPGFATRNPYAGFGMLCLIVATFRSVTYGALLAAVIGVVHGGARALALTRDIREIRGADYLLSVLRTIRWRTIDGILLVATAGVASATLALYSRGGR